MSVYYRPIAQIGAPRPAEALPLAGGWAWFCEVEQITRAGAKTGAQTGARPRLPAAALPGAVRARLTAPRAPFAGLSLEAPRIMGILNTTPDSFSDGGQFDAPEAALAQARAMAAEGAHILDIGGESTRPGAAPLPEAQEIARTAPIIAALRAEGFGLPISIDTRKAAVAEAALEAGAGAVNDVASLGFDPALGPLVAARGVDLCLMHAQGTPETMQIDPRYENVLLDVYDWLEARIARAEQAGIARARIVADPGIGFGKTLAHNLALLKGLSLFHGLGCALLLGASRKSFIARASRGEGAEARLPGSLAAALAGYAQGVQIIRVHDVGETAQALAVARGIAMAEEG